MSPQTLPGNGEQRADLLPLSWLLRPLPLFWLPVLLCLRSCVLQVQECNFTFPPYKLLGKATNATIKSITDNLCATSDLPQCLFVLPTTLCENSLGHSYGEGF